MLRIRCIFVSLVLAILLDEGNCLYQAANWKEYQKAYGINQYKPEHRYYFQYNPEASNGYTGTFKINGEAHELPVAATAVFLYTKDTIPYWFKSLTMVIRNYFDGSPLKMSTLHENGSISVKYLGNKFDPMCKNLNCQRVDIVPMNSVQKRELVDPNGWSSFQSILVPYAKGIKGAMKKTSDEKLRCNLDGA